MCSLYHKLRSIFIQRIVHRTYSPLIIKHQFNADVITKVSGSRKPCATLLVSTIVTRQLSRPGILMVQRSLGHTFIGISL